MSLLMPEEVDRLRRELREVQGRIRALARKLAVQSAVLQKVLDELKQLTDHRP